LPTPRLSDELAQEAADAFRAACNKTEAAKLIDLPRQTFEGRLKIAAERGMLGTKPVLPGFRISQVSTTPNGDYVQQKPEHGDVFEMPDGLALKGVTALVDADGRLIHKHVMGRADASLQADVLAATVAAMKEDLPRLSPVGAPLASNADLLNQYVVTDSHFGMLAHREETGADYDLKLAEALLLDWFTAAIAASPPAHTALLAQLGDLMHHDALESVTPAHKHVLDADSRLHKVVRVVIRTLRRIVDMLLAKHQHVHVIMASGNHDPASSVWVRELLAAIYELEPRVSVDCSPRLYYAYQWGETALFFHHGHKRNINNVDATLAGMFREIFGASKYSFAHVGHLHSDEGRKGALMYVERHETLAAPDAYAAGGGWLSGRSAKVITYHKDHGEVWRSTLRPEMVAGARKLVAANDNRPQGETREAA
jgi:hypothetical protein